MVARLILNFLEGPVLLALDRTNWNFGKFEINILVLSAVYKGCSFPLFWTFLPHKGCSSQDDRINLIKVFLEEFGADRIEALVADREFIGPEWLNFLDKNGVTFHVRLRNNTLSIK